MKIENRINCNKKEAQPVSDINLYLYCRMDISLIKIMLNVLEISKALINEIIYRQKI